jgi:hypothetical protein
MNKMTRLFRSYWYLAAGLLAALVIWVGCTPEKGGALGPLPKASFSILGGGDSNSVTTVNNSPATIAYWSAPGKGNQSGDSAHFRFTFSGSYPITETVIGHGGLDTLTQMVTINQNDPTACMTTVQGFIAGCTSKTWKLNPAAGAEGVGPSAGNTSWWGNAMSDVTTARVCDWNDTYTFAFDAAGDFTFNNQGDYYTENYMGNAAYDCDVNSDLTATEAPWATQNQHYTVSETGGVAGLGQLTVVGLGAHIGLARVTNGADITTGPVNSITYDIISMTHDPGGFDLLVLAINEGSSASPVWWTWTLHSY